MAGQDGWTVVADPTSAWKPVVQPDAPVAGAGALGLPQPAAHPAVNMQSSALSPSLYGSRLLGDAKALVSPLLHIPSQIASYPGFVDPSKQGGPIQTYQDNPDKGQGLANALTDTGVGLGTGKLLGKAPEIAAKSGALLQDAGSSLLNSKFGPTMKEIGRGANPGRGMLEAGIGPTLTKGSLSGKVADAQNAIGSRIGDAVTNADQNASAPPIYSQDLASHITSPINKAVGSLNGPFGTAPTEPYETMRGKLGNTAPGATKPIFGPDAPAEVLPSDLWKHIQNLDQNTRFNTNPEVESVNETRRDIRQGLRPALESVDPSIRPLSRTYSDLLTADNAIDRSQSPSMIPRGLSSVVDSTLKSTPLVTTGASALFKTGGLLNRFAARGGVGVGPAGLPFSPKGAAPLASPKLLGSDTVGVPGGQDFTAGGFSARPNIVTPPPPSYPGLPSSATAGDVQPMVGVRSPNQPALAEDFSRTRIVPTRGELKRMGGTTLAPTTQGLALPEGGSLLRLPSTTDAGESQPMIGIRNDYPQLASPFARERVPANVFARAEAIPTRNFTVDENGQLIPDRLALPSPPKKASK